MNIVPDDFDSLVMMQPVEYYILEVAIVRVRDPFYFEGYVKHGKDGLGKIQI